MSAPSEEFWSIAAHAGFVTTEAADNHGRRTAELNVAPMQVAMETGALNATQIDIVETLRRPRDLVPGYEVLEHIGHGGMGVVYRARQSAFERIVALKTILIGNHSNSNVLARFEQEAKTIGRLVHPHLVTAYDFGRHGGRLFLAMEFLDGEDAEQWIADRHPVSEAAAWGIIRQAAAGLAYAASEGVIHRDIKPANLLLVPPPPGFSLPPGVPLVKVADFGLALLLEDVEDRTRLTRDNATVGSPQYMAPEQLNGSRVDQRADIYALGATAYHLLTGRAPFEGLTLAQVYAQKLHGEPPPLIESRRDVTAATVQLVADLMVRDPDQRLQGYVDLLERIDELLLTPMKSVVTQSMETQATGRHRIREQTLTSISTSSASTAASGRRRWMKLAVVGALALLTAGGVWSWFGMAHRPAAARDWISTGWEVACYNGRSLAGWKTVNGTWIPGQDDGEGGRVLAGAKGLIAFPLMRPDGASRRPLTGYQIVLLACVHEAAAAELHFGLDLTDKPSQSQRFVVRLLPERVEVGLRPSDHGPLTQMLGHRNLPGGPHQFHELRVDAQSRDWSVTVDGSLVATIPFPRLPMRHEFLLAAESSPDRADGVAWFGDISLEELGPRAANSRTP